MIFSRKINLIHIGIISILIVVCLFMAADVNKRFPEARLVTNDENNSVMWMGCRIKAVEKKLYTIDEFCMQYPEVDYFNTQIKQEYEGVVLYRVEVTNCNESKVSFNISRYSDCVAYDSLWFNGVMPLGKSKVLEPGETAIVEGVGYYGPDLLRKSRLDDFADNEFMLIFSYYPERVVLKFD